MAHPRLRSILLDKNLLWPENTVASVCTHLLYHALTTQKIAGPTPTLDPNLVLSEPDLIERNRSMSIYTGTPEGFIAREQNNNPHHSSYTLWHLSMPEAELNPTEYLELLLRFNRTGNPRLAG